MLAEATTAAADAWLVGDYTSLGIFLLAAVGVVGVVAPLAAVVVDKDFGGYVVAATLVVLPVVYLVGSAIQMIPSYEVQDQEGAVLDSVPFCDAGVWNVDGHLYRAPDATCGFPAEERVPLTAAGGAVKVSAVTVRDIAWNLDVDEPDVLVHRDAVRVRKDGTTTVYQVVSFIRGGTWLVPQD